MKKSLRLKRSQKAHRALGEKYEKKLRDFSLSVSSRVDAAHRYSYHAEIYDLQRKHNKFVSKKGKQFIAYNWGLRKTAPKGY